MHITCSMNFIWSFCKSCGKVWMWTIGQWKLRLLSLVTKRNNSWDSSIFIKKIFEDMMKAKVLSWRMTIFFSGNMMASYVNEKQFGSSTLSCPAFIVQKICRRMQWKVVLHWYPSTMLGSCDVFVSEVAAFTNEQLFTDDVPFESHAVESRLVRFFFV